MKVTKTESKESTKHSCGYGCCQKDSAEHEGEGGALIGMECYNKSRANPRGKMIK